MNRLHSYGPLDCLFSIFPQRGSECAFQGPMNCHVDFVGKDSDCVR